MKIFRKMTGLSVVAALLMTGVPAWAGLHTVQTAEQVRKLDIMLMVSSLRCRTGPNDFRAEYRRFSANHLAELNSASRTLTADLARSHGSKRAKRALDRMSIGMANRYGAGHPFLSCAQLKAIVADLSVQSEAGVLLAAAGELLSDQPSGRYAMVDLP